MIDLKNREFLHTLSVDWDFCSDNSKETGEYLIDLMIKNNGIGLAANQVGLNKRIFAIGSTHMDYFKHPTVVFNPKIISVSDEKSIYKEGCLSFPGIWLSIKRPLHVLVEYFDYKKDLKRVHLKGLDAVCFQHEYDHLDGICFVDKVSKLKLQLAMRKLRKNTNDRT